MADGFIEKRQQDYEARKAAYLSRKNHRATRLVAKREIERPEDDAL
jgi:hypothetical protein